MGQGLWDNDYGTMTMGQHPWDDTTTQQLWDNDYGKMTMGQ